MVGLEFGIQFYVIDVAVICEGDIQKSTVCFVLCSRGEAKEKKNEERRHDVGAEKHLIFVFNAVFPIVIVLCF